MKSTRRFVVSSILQTSWWLRAPAGRGRVPGGGEGGRLVGAAAAGQGRGGAPQDGVQQVTTPHHLSSLSNTRSRVAGADSWTTMYKFDETPRELAEFQPRCDEYQTDTNVQLAAMPVAIIKVGALADQRLHKKR